MRMAAHDDVHTQIAQLLGNGALLIADGGGIFVTPVQIQHDGLGALGTHGGDFVFDLLIESAEIVVIKGADQCRIRAGGGVVVQCHLAVGADVCEGISCHAHLDAADVLDRMAGFILGFGGAQCGQILILQHGQGAGQTGGAVVEALLVGSQQHIKARDAGAFGNGIGTVEVRRAGVFLSGSAGKGGLQIGNSIIRRDHIALDVSKHIGEIVAVVGLIGAHDGHMGQNIARHGDLGAGDLHHFTGIDMNRLGGIDKFIDIHHRRILTRQLHHIIAISKQTEAEGDRRLARQHQQHDHKGQRDEADGKMQSPADMELFLFFFHSIAP